MLGKLLDVIAVRVAAKKEAVLLGHDAEVADAALQAGLDVGFEGVEIDGSRVRSR
jgi:hypothetical protein